MPDDRPLGLTPNECQAARYLSADGYTTAEIGDALGVSRKAVEKHLREECPCPDLDEPRAIPPIDGDELRATRKEAGLTQTELASQVDTSYATISQLERETVSPSPSLRLRLHEWIDDQD